MAKDKTLQSILHNPRLPSLPAVAIRVLELTRDENVNFREVAQVIENDQALSIKIIRTVNSSYFGLSRPCTSINQAIVFLGIEAVKTLVLGFSLVDSIDGSSDHDIGFDYASYWRRSLHSAVAAREIAQHMSICDPEEAFLAALVQDLGMVVLYRAYRDVYIQILDLTNGDHALLITKERKSLETDHAEVGAAIGEMWKLPQQLVAAIRHHHEPKKSARTYADLARIVELAGKVSDKLDLGDPTQPTSDDEPRAADRLNRAMRELMNLDEADIESLMLRVYDGATELASLFKVNIQTPIAVDQIMSEAEDLRIQREIRAQRSADFAETCPQNGATATAAHPATAAKIVSPPLFRQQLRSAITEAHACEGCVGVMIGEFTPSSKTAATAGTAAAPIQRIVEEIGNKGVICTDGAARVMLFIPRADRITIARLAHTIRQHLGPSTEEPVSEPGAEAGAWHVNIGAAAFEYASRSVIVDEQKLLSLAEHALNLALSSGPGAIRVFNPMHASERAA